MALLGGALLMLGACDRVEDAARPPSASQPGAAAAPEASAGDPVVARVGDRAITAADVDATIQFALHDLETQKYRLRRQVLEAEVLRALEGVEAGRRTARVALEPPVPPRVTVQADPGRVRPAGDAAVTVLAFCNFESPHCRRLQLALTQVLPLFEGVVRYAERDLPLGFHRHAGRAAEAARCALELGGYWRFHDNLYAGSGAPDGTALERAARASGLDGNAFGECLESGRYAPAVDEDVALAKSLGLAAVPAVFVNGVYASPEVRPSDLVWLIERELASLGRTSPRAVASEATSTAPFRLQTLLVSPVPGQGLALIAPSAAPERFGAFREGDAIATGLVLRRIDEDGIEVLRDGRAERMGLEAAPGPVVDPAEQVPEDLAAAHPHRAVPVTLDRDRVLVLLSDRIGLAQAMQPVPMTAGGHRLMKVQAVAPGSLYELLGIEPGDVILSVNEQPVTEAFNPLWDALEQQGEVRVRVMRRGGLAQHFTYRFDR